MNAVRVIGGEVRVVDARSPQAGAGEAIIRMVRAGIGDAEIAVGCGGGGGGRASEYTLGREFVGMVEEVNPRAGREDQRRWTGKRVAGSGIVVCGVCERCRSGLALHCAQRSVLGAGRDGCFAERFSLPVVNLVEVPKGIEDDAAALIAMVAAAVHATRVVKVDGKQVVTVLGDSPSGLVIGQIAAARNQSVRLLGMRAERFTLCEKWGIKHRHADEAGRRQDQDIVIDAVGEAWSLRLAGQLVRPRGAVVVCAEPAGDGAREGAAELVRVARGQELTLHGAAGENFPEAIGLVESGAVDVRSLIGSRMKLGEAASGIRAAGADGVLKVILAA